MLHGNAFHCEHPPQYDLPHTQQWVVLVSFCCKFHCQYQMEAQYKQELISIKLLNSWCEVKFIRHKYFDQTKNQAYIYYLLIPSIPFANPSAKTQSGLKQSVSVELSFPEHLKHAYCKYMLSMNSTNRI